MGNENKLIYPELSYRIIGLLFEIHNAIGGGHKEKYIQNAIAIEFAKNKIRFEKEVYCPLVYQKEKIGRYFFDFLIEDKIILEIKVGARFDRGNINQVYSYLQSKKLKLGIIANFTKQSVKFKRILNIN